MVCIDDDNGGRRSAADRRRFLYGLCIPECRTGKDRRSQADRRRKESAKLEGMKERRVIFRESVTTSIAVESVYHSRYINK